MGIGCEGMLLLGTCTPTVRPCVFSRLRLITPMFDDVALRGGGITAKLLLQSPSVDGFEGFSGVFCNMHQQKVVILRPHTGILVLLCASGDLMCVYWGVGCNLWVCWPRAVLRLCQYSCCCRAVICSRTPAKVVCCYVLHALWLLCLRQGLLALFKQRRHPWFPRLAG